MKFGMLAMELQLDYADSIDPSLAPNLTATEYERHFCCSQTSSSSDEHPGHPQTAGLLGSQRRKLIILFSRPQPAAPVNG